MPKAQKLTRKEMWERIKELSAYVQFDEIAARVLPEVPLTEITRLADRQLTSDIRHWLLARAKKDAPEQLTLIPREDGAGTYDSLDEVPAPLLRKRSIKLRRLGMALLKIADAIDAVLAGRAEEA